MLPATPNTWWWPNDPVVEGNDLRVPVYQMTNGGAQPFPLVFTGLQGIATFSLPSLIFKGISTSLDDPTGPIYGQSILQTADYDYIYSSVADGLVSHAYVARVPRGQLTDPAAWTFYTGTDWSTDPHDSQPIADVNPQAVIQRGAGGFAMFYVPTFSNEVQVAYSCSPTGPWSDGTSIYTAPQAGGNIYAYGTAVHPEIDDATGQLLVSYDTNSFDPADASKVDIYRPHFVRVNLPPVTGTEPNLVVTSVTAGPSGVKPGQPVTISATIKNVGTTATPLMPGQSRTVTPDFPKATWTATTAGYHSLVAAVDSTSQIYESSDVDNTRSLTPAHRLMAGRTDPHQHRRGRVPGLP